MPVDDGPACDLWERLGRGFRGMTRSKRILAVASAGGHFHQLMQMRGGYARHRVCYVTTLPGLAETFGVGPARLVPDCNARTPFRTLACAAAMTWYVLRMRPHVVVTTGALPGVLAVVCGRLAGARTMWVDSIANAEELSASGRLARRIAHLTLSQWPAVAEAEDVGFEGSVL